MSFSLVEGEFDRVSLLSFLLLSRSVYIFPYMRQIVLIPCEWINIFFFLFFFYNVLLIYYEMYSFVILCMEFVSVVTNVRGQMWSVDSVSIETVS